MARFEYEDEDYENMPELSEEDSVLTMEWRY